MQRTSPPTVMADPQTRDVAERHQWALADGVVSRHPAFNVDVYLRSAGEGKRIRTYRRGEQIFARGDAADSVMYVQEGTVRLSVTSHGGKEAVVAILGSGDFFGEGALAGGADRSEAATALTAATVLIIQNEQMIRRLHEQPTLSDRFLRHVLARNRRLEEDVVDQKLHTSEQRLARALLLLAHAAQPGATPCVRPRISQLTLAQMIGTTRSRVNRFMNQFEQRGLIDCRAGLTINPGRLADLLRDEREETPTRKTG
jgi:CRP/FNR family transcriptional regulator, cyclic AMP receptor protein